MQETHTQPFSRRNRPQKRRTTFLAKGEKLEDRMLLAAGTIVPAGFHNSFDDALAVAESGPLVNSGITFSDGGVRVDSGDRLSFATEGNLNAMKGHLSFRFKPNWDGATDNTTRYFLNSGPFRIFKYHSTSAGKSYFVFRFDDGVDGGNGTFREVSSSSLEPNVVESWQAGTWHDIAVEWDLTLPAGQQYLRFSIDGIHTKTQTNTWEHVQDLGSAMTIGTNNSFGNLADGVMDELRIDAEPKLTFAASLNSSDSVLASNGVSSNVTFEPAAVNGGARVEATDQLHFPTAGNLDKNKGKISFKFKPNWDGATDNATRYFLNSGPFRIFKYHSTSAGKSYFVFRFDDGIDGGNGTFREVSSSSLEPNVVESWQAGTWHDIEVQWDLTLPSGQQFMEFTVDGVHTKTLTKTWDQVQSLESDFHIGSSSGTSYFADGVFDEVRIYREPGVDEKPLLALHAPLESVTSAMDSGAVETSGISPSLGEVGNGVQINGSDRLRFNTSGILNKEQGTISFRFKPNWDGASDNQVRYFLDAGELRVFKWHNNTTGMDYFVFRFDDAQGNQREVTSTGVEPGGVESWNAGQWHTIELFWDLTGDKGHLGFSIDGEVSSALSVDWIGVPDLDSSFVLGATSSFGSQADGVFDELKIYDKSLWDFENPVDSYVAITQANGQWDPHETVHDSNDAPVLDSAILPTENFLFYEKETFDRVYPGTVPNASEIVDGIQKPGIDYTLAKDDFETLFFNLYTRQTLNDVTVSFSDFTNGQSILADAEIKVVKNWWQAGVTQFKSVFPQYIPEFLLSDDVNGDAAILDAPEAIRQEGWDSHDLPSFPKLPEVHTSLPSLTSKQFAIVVHAPVGTDAGSYTSTVTLKDSQGNTLKTLDLTIEVLSFALRAPEKDYLIYHTAVFDSEASWSDHAVSLDRYTKQVQDIARHGINGLVVYGSTSAANVASSQTTRINLIKSNGIDGKVFFIRDLTPQARDLLIANGYETYAYGFDEPNSNARVVTHINKSDDIHDLGGKVITAITRDWLEKLENENDPIYSLPGLDVVDLQDGTGSVQAEPLDYANLSLVGSQDYINDLIDGIVTNDKPSSYYWQSMQELASTNRSRAGFYLWNTGLEGVFPYVYQDIKNNPYDDFDDWSSPEKKYRDHLTTSPSLEGPVTTIQWEAFREGIDDVRYLRTWEHYHDNLAQVDPSAAANSRAIIDSMLDHYKDLATLDSISPETFAADRTLIRSQILQLRTKLGIAQELYSSLNHSASITDIGGTHSNSLTFQDGGALVNAGDDLSFATANTLRGDKGRISFRFKPQWDGPTDNTTRYFLNSGPFKIFKYHSNSSGKDYFVFRFDDGIDGGNGTFREVSSSSLEPNVVESWQAGTWHDIEVEWDLTLPEGQQYLKFTIDNLYSKTKTSTWDQVQSLTTDFHIGSFAGSSHHAEGVFDELRVFLDPSEGLHAEGAEVLNSQAAALNDLQLQDAVDEAKRRWLLAGANASLINTLSVSIGDLSGNLLGSTSGNHIVIDRNAAGYGWYVDPHLQTDREFYLGRNPTGMDLLTVVMHEYGHALGYGHDDPNDGIATLMDDTLGTGERRSTVHRR